jgi:hypothetical protein
VSIDDVISAAFRHSLKSGSISNDDPAINAWAASFDAKLRQQKINLLEMLLGRVVFRRRRS